MKSRYWVTLSFRLIGVVLIGITIRPLALTFAGILEWTVREQELSWDRIYPSSWAGGAALFALGLYLLLDGSWVVNRVLRGLEPNRCPKCGYDKHGLKPGAVCPECGARADHTEEH